MTATHVIIQEKSANQAVHWTPTPALFMKFCGRLSVHLYSNGHYRVGAGELNVRGENRVPLENSGSILLQKAKEEHLKIFEIDSDGIGVHWPILDEDLSISGLLRSVGREDLVISDIPSIYSEDFEAKAS